jgi:PmbA protein
MEKLLAKASQSAQQAETLQIQDETIGVSFEAAELKKIGSKNTTGYALRLIKDNRLGTTFGTAPLAADEMLEQALMSTRYGDTVSFSFPKSAPLKKLKLYDEKITQLSIDEMRQTGETIINQVKKLAPDLVPDVGIGKEISHFTIANSQGLKTEYQRTGYEVAVSLRIKGSKASVAKMHSSGNYFQFPNQKITDLINEYRLCDIRHSIPTGKMPVVFTPQATWSLLYRVYAAVNGEAIYRGISPLGDKLNQKIFDERINVLDNPEMDFGVQSCPCDDEGVSTQKRYIVEKGVLKSFLFDLSTAAKNKTQSTGNGYKRGMWGGGIEISPNPVFANFTLEGGSLSMSDIIKDMKNGLIVDEVLGFHSGNIIQGEFSMNVGVGYLVQNGTIKGRAMDAMVAGNIYDSFNKLAGLGNEVELSFIGYMPAMYFKEMSIAGK